MAKDFITEQLKKEFRDRESISRDELFAFYKRFEPDLKDTTFRWRVFDLKQKQIISPISKELFSFAYKPVYKPEIDEVERKLYLKIEKQFPSLRQCVWSTKIVAEFMLHQPGRFITILEVEKDAIEPVFHYLKDLNIPNVYFQPEEKEIERYIYETETAIIIQSLISKAPTQKIRNVNTEISTTTIEKLIVDLYCGKKIFNAFQGSELVNIINNANRRYAIDFTKLIHYAKRRGKEVELIDFLGHQTDIQKSIFND